MSESVRSRILTAIVAALNVAEGKPDGLTIHRSRALPIETDALPATVVYVIGEETTRVPAPGSRKPVSIHQLMVRCEHRAAGAPDAELDLLLEAQLVWAVQQILQDETFGGLATKTQEVRATWVDDVPGDRAVAAVAHEFQVTYPTDAHDATLSL